MAASTFLFHPLMNEVVPYNANYEFPSQATRSLKRTIKITPKNNVSSYVSGTTIRFEFPASGYLNPTKTYLAFNCRSRITGGTFAAGTDQLITNMTPTVTAGNSSSSMLTQLASGGFAFQQNIASIFRRVRVLYGSLVLEDIQDYNVLQRMLVDTLLPSGTGLSDTCMMQGIGGFDVYDPNTVQGNRFNYHSDTAVNAVGTNFGTVGHRYAIPINTGVFQQKRLIPLKFMSSQLAIELEVAEAVDCQFWLRGSGGSPSVPTAAQTEIGLAEINAELLEFDSEFDRAVFTGLGSGLAIPFQSWHMTSQNIASATAVTVNIQESSRSVRYALAALTDDNYRTLYTDAHIFWPGLANGTPVTTSAAGLALNTAGATSNLVWNSGGGTGNIGTIYNTLLQQYQWRLGGVYYPSQPVPAFGGTGSSLQPGTSIDANYSDPPVEPYLELMKVFDNQFGAKGGYFGESNQGYFGARRVNATATTKLLTSNFVIGVDFLTDRGDIIGGINAEEQNDMQITLNFTGTTSGTAKVLRICVCFDNIMILGESNNMVLVN